MGGAAAPAGGGQPAAAVVGARRHLAGVIFARVLCDALVDGRVQYPAFARAAAVVWKQVG